jgi:hypothetical protein
MTPVVIRPLAQFKFNCLSLDFTFVFVHRRRVHPCQAVGVAEEVRSVLQAVLLPVRERSRRCRPSGENNVSGIVRSRSSETPLQLCHGDFTHAFLTIFVVLVMIFICRVLQQAKPGLGSELDHESIMCSRLRSASCVIDKITATRLQSSDFIGCWMMDHLGSLS